MASNYRWAVVVGEVNNEVISQAPLNQSVELEKLHLRGFILVNYDQVPRAAAQAQDLEIHPQSRIFFLKSWTGVAR